MNPRNAAEVALGVADIWLIVSRLPDLGVSLAFSPAEPDGLLRWLGVVHFSLVVLCGLGLVLLRRRLASWLVPTQQAQLNGSVPGLQAAAFSVVGLLVLVKGLADFAARLGYRSLVANWDRSVEQFALPLAQIAVGLSVFLGAKGLVGIWQSLRTAGRPNGDRDRGAA